MIIFLNFYHLMLVINIMY